MATYAVKYTRTVSVTEYVTREIEAQSEDDAWDQARVEADGFNSDCPDDVLGDDDGECGDWGVEMVTPPAVRA